MPPSPPPVNYGLQQGAFYVVQPAYAIDTPQWAGFSQPAAGAQATVTRSATTGINQVFVGLFVSAVVTTLLAAGVVLIVNVRDSTSGAGTILWSTILGLPNGAAVGTQAQFGITGLRIGGSAGNSMTAEFAALNANVQQAVTFWGFSSQT